MEKNNFLVEFQDDHDWIRKILNQVLAACFLKDRNQAEERLNKLNAVCGPHYQFEEEALFAELLPIFGSEYIDKLFTDHDFVIARTQRLIELFSVKRSEEPDFETAVRLLQSLQLQLVECESICPKIGSLSTKKTIKLKKALTEIRMKGLSLTDWAENIRNREKLKIHKS